MSMLSSVKEKLLLQFYSSLDDTDVDCILIDVCVVNERMLSIIKCDNNYFLCYNLQDREVITKDNKKASIKELLICCIGVEMDFNNLENVLSGKLTINEYLDLHSNFYRVGQINEKIYEPKIVMLEDITDYIPKKEAYLTDFVGLYTIIKNY